MYLVPSAALDVGRNYPDWSEAVCATAFINNTAEGGGNMRFAYKNDKPESNGYPGHDYWTTDNGDVYAGGEGPGADGTGKGGTLACVNSASILGTWSATFTNSTTVEITAPDGQTATGTLQPETAALFSGHSSAADALLLRSEKWKLLQKSDFLNLQVGFFRLHKP